MWTVEKRYSIRTNNTTYAVVSNNGRTNGVYRTSEQAKEWAEILNKQNEAKKEARELAKNLLEGTLKGTGVLGGKKYEIVPNDIHGAKRGLRNFVLYVDGKMVCSSASQETIAEHLTKMVQG